MIFDCRPEPEIVRINMRSRFSIVYSINTIIVRGSGPHFHRLQMLKAPDKTKGGRCMHFLSGDPANELPRPTTHIRYVILTFEQMLPIFTPNLQRFFSHHQEEANRTFLQLQIELCNNGGTYEGIAASVMELQLGGSSACFFLLLSALFDVE